MSPAIALFIAAIGMYAFAAAAFDWDFFLEHPKASLFVNILDRQKARVFYSVFGLALIGFGAWHWF